MHSRCRIATPQCYGMRRPARKRCPYSAAMRLWHDRRTKPTAPVPMGQPAFAWDGAAASLRLVPRTNDSIIPHAIPSRAGSLRWRDADTLRCRRI